MGIYYFVWFSRNVNQSLSTDCRYYFKLYDQQMVGFSEEIIFFIRNPELRSCRDYGMISIGIGIGGRGESDG